VSQSQVPEHQPQSASSSFSISASAANLLEPLRGDQALETPIRAAHATDAALAPNGRPRGAQRAPSLAQTERLTPSSWQQTETMVQVFFADIIR